MGYIISTQILSHVRLSIRPSSAVSAAGTGLVIPTANNLLLEQRRLLDRPMGPHFDSSVIRQGNKT